MNTTVDLEFSGLVNKKLVMKRAFLTHEDEENEGTSTSESQTARKSKSPEGWILLRTSTSTSEIGRVTSHIMCRTLT